jgi:hypothetical protein
LAHNIIIIRGEKIEKALLLEACFISQQMIYHGTGNENITARFERKTAGGVGLGKSSQCSH